MPSFHINSFGAAVIMSVLIMGLLGAFVLVPIACIQWAWNAVAAHFLFCPLISAWQAVLLYGVCACLLYLSGLIQIEVKTERLGR